MRMSGRARAFALSLTLHIITNTKLKRISKKEEKNEIYIVCMYKLNPNDELLCFMTTVDDGSRTAAAATAAITKSHICLH